MKKKYFFIATGLLSIFPSFMSASLYGANNSEKVISIIVDDRLAGLASEVKDLMGNKNIKIGSIYHEGFSAGACEKSERLIVIGNSSYKAVQSLDECRLIGNKNIIGTFLYPESYLSKSVLKNSYKFYTTPGLLENILLAYNNGFRKIGVVYSDEFNRSQATIGLLEKDVMGDMEVNWIKVRSDSEVLKGVGVLSRSSQVVVIGFNPDLFTDKIFQILPKISIKLLIPILGGQHQNLTSKGVTSGAYYSFSSNLQAIEYWVKSLPLNDQKVFIKRNKKMENHMGKKFKTLGLL